MLGFFFFFTPSLWEAGKGNGIRMVLLYWDFFFYCFSVVFSTGSIRLCYCRTTVPILPAVPPNPILYSWGLSLCLVWGQTPQGAALMFSIGEAPGGAWC